MTQATSQAVAVGLGVLINLSGKLRMLSHRAVMAAALAERAGPEGARYRETLRSSFVVELVALNATIEAAHAGGLGPRARGRGPGNARALRRGGRLHQGRAQGADGALLSGGPRDCATESRRGALPEAT